MNWKISSQITAHAWSPDKKSIAICPNTEDVLIYSNANDPDFNKWKLEHTLTGHDLVVSGIDWSPVHNKIVTCSHDRNAFVWTFTNGEWKPSLSILRINRAALAVKWSPDGKKFAVASGAKVVPVCHYEQQNDWWISKMIKKHKSTVLDVAWHPNSQLLATASSDFKCRIFSAFIEEVDQAVQSPFGDTSKLEFGNDLAELDGSNGWVESCAWSPSGNLLAYVGHDSSLSVANISSGTPKSFTTKSSGLPSTKVIFLSEKVIVVAGHTFIPSIYQNNGGDAWELLGQVEIPKGAPTGGAKDVSAVDAAKSMWANKTTKGQESSEGDSAPLTSTHTNTITNMAPYGDTQWATQVDAFSTCGLDGKVVVWKAKDIKAHLKGLAI